MSDTNSKNKLISIVLPVFNEEGNIKELYQRLKSVLVSIEYAYELIFVDDGSQDQSLDFLKKMNKVDKSVKAISYSRNFGHQLAITGGMDYASGDAIIIMDTDLQHPPEIIPQLIKKWEEGYDVVSTIREDEKNIEEIITQIDDRFSKIILGQEENINIQEKAEELARQTPVVRLFNLIMAHTFRYRKNSPIQ